MPQTGWRHSAGAAKRTVTVSTTDRRLARQTKDVSVRPKPQTLERPMLKRIESGNEPPRAPLATPGPETAVQRVGRYLLVLALLGVVVGVAGGVVFDATQCSGADFDGECDLAGFAAIWYALIAVAVGAVLIGLVEILRAFRRR